MCTIIKYANHGNHLHDPYETLCGIRFFGYVTRKCHNNDNCSIENSFLHINIFMFSSLTLWIYYKTMTIGCKIYHCAVIDRICVLLGMFMMSINEWHCNKLNHIVWVTLNTSALPIYFICLIICVSNVFVWLIQSCVVYL